MERKKQDDKSLVLNICLRYAVLLAIALGFSFSSVFYLVLLKITIYPVSFLISLFTGLSSIVISDIILVDYSVIIQLIPACVAASAYFLLLIFNISTPMESAKKRLYSLIFSFALFSLFNILRIFALSVLLISRFVYFDIVHKITWYSLSIMLVACTWFLTAYLFKIRKIPVYSDFKYMAMLSGLGKRK